MDLVSKNSISDVNILQMQQNDINAVIEILVDNKLETWSCQDFVAELTRDDSICLVAKFNHLILGFSIARLITNYDRLDSDLNSTSYKNLCEIYNIAVIADYYHWGVGKKILYKLIGIAQQYKTNEIWLEVRKSNKRAIDFYERNNFIKTYERNNFYTNPTENALVMKRDLID